MFTLEKLGKHIKYYREKQNLSYYTLEKLSGISKEYLIKIEKGKAKRIKVSQIKNLCDCFKITLFDFICEVENE